MADDRGLATKASVNEDLAVLRNNLGEAWIGLEHAIGQEIRMLREKRGLSQSDFATLLAREGFALHQTAIAKMENGKRPIRVAELFAISKVFGLTPAALLYLPDDVLTATGFAVDLDADLKRIEQQTQHSRDHYLRLIRELIEIEVESEVRRHKLIRAADASGVIERFAGLIEPVDGVEG